MSAPTRKSKKTTPVRAVTVRMYNVGFGDAFLVEIPAADRPRRMLFDCGSISSGGPPMSAVVRRIIADVTDADGKARVDVVVATHRHRDHVSGFADKAWNKVEVQEVWMPWTEDTADAQATEIREAQSRLAAALDQGIRRKLALRGLGAAARGALAASATMVSNALTNETEMNVLHAGFAGNPRRRFLPVRQPGHDVLLTSALPGVTTYVMGPSRDKAVIRDMDPPAGGAYLRLAASAADSEDGAPEPFREDWWLPPAEYDAGHLVVTPMDRKAIASVGADTEQAVAVALDQAVNGTSLMLMLKVGKAHLLFPGDAQWGTWQAALANSQWRALMAKTSFYKIGHHGSHNATPREFVEQAAGQGFEAMASTRSMPNWPRIPKQELLAALRGRKVKIARSDQDGDAAKLGFKVEAGLIVETRIPI